MRKVKITFEDGRTEDYDTLKEASTALRIDKSTLLRLECGASKHIKALLRIESVEIKENKGKSTGLRKVGGRPCRLICTSEKGRVIEAESIKDAYKKLRYKHYINSLIDDGQYHWGWKFDSVEEQDEVLRYKDPVPDEVLKKIYKYAYHYLRKLYTMPEEDKRDFAQYIASHVASDYSTGRFDRYKEIYRLDKWLYLRVVHHGGKQVAKWLERQQIIMTQDDGDLDNTDWLELLAGGREDAEEARLLEDLPEEFKGLAKMLLDGRSRIEIDTRLKLRDSERKALMQKLGEWLIRRKRQ